MEIDHLLLCQLSGQCKREWLEKRIANASLASFSIEHKLVSSIILYYLMVKQKAWWTLLSKILKKSQTADLNWNRRQETKESRLPDYQSRYSPECLQPWPGLQGPWCRQRLQGPKDPKEWRRSIHTSLLRWYQVLCQCEADVGIHS